MTEKTLTILSDINLCFDFSQGPTTVSMSDFTESFDHLNFDEVLRYVSFGRVEVQKLLQVPRVENLSKRLPQGPKPGRGRSDLSFFFDWIYQKGVRHIIKVIVEDLKDPPHTDMAIEESLRRFEVEILDWRKMDLCPTTIFYACRNVREVYLRWSGNRAILKAWGEPDGLPRLEKLERVHLLWDPEQVSVESYVIEEIGLMIAIGLGVGLPDQNVP
jgi:hypothetical protein